MIELVRTLNRSLDANSALEDDVLEHAFEAYWPQFEKRFAGIIKETPAAVRPEPRSRDNMLDEILENTRYLNKKVNSLEVRFKTERGLDAARGWINTPSNRSRNELVNAALKVFATSKSDDDDADAAIRTINEFSTPPFDKSDPEKPDK